MCFIFAILVSVAIDPEYYCLFAVVCGLLFISILGKSDCSDTVVAHCDISHSVGSFKFILGNLSVCK